MEESSPALRDSPSVTAEQPEPKRRKVRKGTQSCWECKRRKVRCTLSATSGENTCDGCERRGTVCISQEFPDELPAAPSATSTRELGDRLGQVEALVERLAKRVGGDDETLANAAVSTTPRRLQHGQRDYTSFVAGQSNEVFARVGVPTPTDSDPEYIATSFQSVSISFQSRFSFLTLGKRDAGSLSPSAQPIAPLPTFFDRDSTSNPARRYEALYAALSTAWPTQADLDTILDAPVSTLGLFHGTIHGCSSYAKALYRDIPPPRDILKLPPAGSHPVIVARMLLVLATYVQNIPKSHRSNLGRRDKLLRDIMGRAIDAASSLVTSNDELVNSIEGVECIMIEGMYQNNSGNLRRAWLAIRRAMLMAQTLGLHRHVGFQSLKTIDPESRTRLEPEYLWFRIVHSDRYLSLMLGLPLGSADNSFATPKALERYSPVERLERILCLAASKILQRNETGMHDLTQTLEIDKLLQQGSANMPAQWWLPPSYDSSKSSDEREILGGKIRLMNQFTHFNLLVHLHLPYILRPANDARLDYSKTTALNASREVLSRFVTFRSNNGTYCRGIDFVTFVASTALCLAHIDVGRQLHANAGTPAPNILAHQRLSDRGILERTLDIMEDVARTGPDAISARISGILRPLLDIEADVSNGGATYSAVPIPTSSVSGNDFESGANDNDKVLHIPIPHFGIIKIEQGGISKMKFAPPGQSERASMNNSSSNTMDFNPGDRANTPTASVLRDAQSSQLDMQAADQLYALEAPNENGHQEVQFFDVGTVLNDDDWALQGVDMAFFESLMRGSMEPDGTEGEMWA